MVVVRGGGHGEGEARMRREEGFPPPIPTSDASGTPRRASLGHEAQARDFSVDTVRQTPVAVEDGGGLVAVLAKMEFQRVAVFGGVGAVGAAVLVHVGVRVHVRVEHGLVDARVVALAALVRLGPEVVAQVVLQVVLVLRHEGALGARQQLLFLDVRARVRPERDLNRKCEARIIIGLRKHQ